MVSSDELGISPVKVKPLSVKAGAKSNGLDFQVQPPSSEVVISALKLPWSYVRYRDNESVIVKPVRSVSAAVSTVSVYAISWSSTSSLRMTLPLASKLKYVHRSVLGAPFQ